VNTYPAMIAMVNHVEPVPRRVRAVVAGETVLDSTKALYVWEWPYYPQYYIPAADVSPRVLVPEGRTRHTSRGAVELRGLSVREVHRPHAAKLLTDSTIRGLANTVHFEWNALDAWFEEDEQVFVHPRNPYVRVDALRSTRRVRVELDGTVLAETSSPVMVFETGLPTRYYINRTQVNFDHLIATDTIIECPYKGRTTGYWSIRVGDTIHPDLAWAYDFPNHQVSPIASLMSFYNEKVDIVVDGQFLERPTTHFFSRPAGRGPTPGGALVEH
jgi:uncharacterized protein (DUF427 family)